MGTIKLVHIHIPKCAGTSINNTLKNMYGKSFNYGRVKTLSKYQKEDILISDCLFGHISYMEILELKIPLSICFTVLRDPVSRCLSWYRMVTNGRITSYEFFKNQGAGFISRTQFKQNCENRMTFQLGSFAEYNRRTNHNVLQKAKATLHRLSKVILYKDLVKNNSISDLGISYLPKLRTGKVLPEANEETIRLIKKINHMDEELYEYASSIDNSRKICNTEHV